MASACVNNIGVSPESFSPATSSAYSYGWLSPRMSFTQNDTKNNSNTISEKDNHQNLSSDSPPEEPTDPAADFEFRLDEYPSAAILPADKLFSGGKLVPLHFSAAGIKSQSLIDDDESSASASPEKVKIAAVKSRRRTEASISGNDPYLFSPKAPRCSSRWREILGLKKLSANPNPNPSPATKINDSHKTTNNSLKNLLHRTSKSYSSSDHLSSSSSLILPLLTTKDSSSSSESIESLSLTSARLSLSSSSSSGHDHDDLPRHSLDFSDRPSAISLHRKTATTAAAGIRTAKPRPPPEAGRSGRGVSAVDSPRMNSSGKIVFQSLERSSSSPSSFNNGGPRYKHHHRAAMERSYSANVRVVTPVLNVPVCSLRVGFGQLFSSPQKRSDPNNNNNNTNRTHCKTRS